MRNFAALVEICSARSKLSRISAACCETLLICGPSWAPILRFASDDNLALTGDRPRRPLGSGPRRQQREPYGLHKAEALPHGTASNRGLTASSPLGSPGPVISQGESNQPPSGIGRRKAVMQERVLIDGSARSRLASTGPGGCWPFTARNLRSRAPHCRKCFQLGIEGFDRGGATSSMKPFVA